MAGSSRPADLSRALLVAVVLAAGGASAAQPTLVAEQPVVVDGDGLIIGPVPVRLHGIDAPEMAQTCATADGGTWPCGAAAADALAALVEGRTVECEPLDRDVYGRTIASCAVEGVDLAGALVDAGLAWAFLRYSTDYVEREAVARDRRVGVWQTATQPPWEYREERWSRASSSAPDDSCPIKGNISADGERIYHTPWSPWCDRTKINENAGERWFCDEAEASAAGWRGARFR